MAEWLIPGGGFINETTDTEWLVPGGGLIDETSGEVGSFSPSLSPSYSPSISPSLSLSLSPSVSPSLSPSISPTPSLGWNSYTRGDYAVLPTNDADLETGYTEQNITDVATNDSNRVSQTATGQYAIHQFKNYYDSEGAGFLWEGQSNMAPSASPVILEIYNYNTSEWEELDRDSVTEADTDFELGAEVVDLTNYRNPSGIVTCRVYQLS